MVSCQAQSAFDEKPTRDKCVLFVDDNHTLLRMIQQALTRFGYDVVTCASGCEALARLREAPQEFDVAIVDCSMQDMAIQLLVQRLRTIRPDMSIVLSTGFNLEALSTNLQTLRCQALLLKPYTLRELARVIQYVIPD